MRHLLPICSRRSFVGLASVVFALEPRDHLSSFATGQAAERPQPVPDAFPRQAALLVQEVVVASHTNANRVRELVEQRPSLARAAVDWGFGDWEDALGAASHMGRRDIAEYLISRGARPSIFSAAMLGQLDVVQAFVAAAPGSQRVAGPHSISLLSHAKAGGSAAAAVYAYLDGLGDAGGPRTEPISDDDKKMLVGLYVFGAHPTERIEITIESGQLTFTRAGMPFGRSLIHVGEWAFFPAGAAAVRIKFAPARGGMVVTVYDPDLLLTGVRQP
jgi:hypothetical protein